MASGSPRAWLDRALPFRVQEDSGLVFDISKSLMDMPLLPAVRAVELMSNAKPVLGEGNSSGGVEWRTVDFVTDRRNLRKLLRWIEGTNPGKDGMRIDAQLAGNGTVLLNGWERRIRRFAQAGSAGYGLNFEKAATKAADGCEHAASHIRVVKYVSHITSSPLYN